MCWALVFCQQPQHAWDIFPDFQEMNSCFQTKGNGLLYSEWWVTTGWVWPLVFPVTGKECDYYSKALLSCSSNCTGRCATWGLNKHFCNRNLNEMLLAVILLSEASELRTVGGKYPKFWRGCSILLRRWQVDSCVMAFSFHWGENRLAPQ